MQIAMRLSHRVNHRRFHSVTPDQQQKDQKSRGEAAHAAAQADEGGAGDWVHAYLHRKEGDASNAAYWYRRARKPFFGASVDAEWQEIAVALLAECKSPPKPTLD